MFGLPALRWGSRTQKGSPSCSCEDAELLVLGAGCRKQQAVFKMDSCLASGATGDAREKLKSCISRHCQGCSHTTGTGCPQLPRGIAVQRPVPML